jgi:hypothetical protein
MFYYTPNKAIEVMLIKGLLNFHCPVHKVILQEETVDRQLNYSAFDRNIATTPLLYRTRKAERLSISPTPKLVRTKQHLVGEKSIAADG